MSIPSLLLKQLYNFSSLHNTETGIQFSIKNRLSNAKLSSLLSVQIDGDTVPLDTVILDLGDDKIYTPAQISADHPLDFPLGQTVTINANTDPLAEGKHNVQIVFDTEPFGELNLTVEDAISEFEYEIPEIPRDNTDDYGEQIIQERQDFVEHLTGVNLEHASQFSFDPHQLAGNIENMTGVAQIPLGFAGPLRVNGEHAKGDFLIPMATSEGTLVASYNRGIKLLNLCGGVKCTVVGDAMQRAPVFVFEDARGARDFVQWVNENMDQIAEEAEATSSVAKLQYIDTFLASKFAYLRFNYTTGDAAGQNMVGRATFAACSWILDTYPNVKHFYLESNFATDKKASQINSMKTRGKRITAEAVINRDILIQRMRIEPEMLAYHSSVANVGALLSGANNNGCHSANAITAMFIATGQDVANVAESSAGIFYAELTPERDLYVSITIPSLIVATHGGGTKLPTQNECLRVMGCQGRGSVYKLAEIIGGVVLAGELSLASAISSSDWVSSHEKYGRNR
ncbi:MAG: hydroxymethylglutaryl-CoA reductase [Candidatus Competibacteraceae bacterium]|jgi:hydroxymethylglutaryl-CoA reductase (NADPH)|nr:hydroxymethylglutaryl-CoA reductase [Candidatus Competibacteraceae bacterium]